MAEPILQLKGLDAHYGLFQALHGVDMALDSGEIVAIIGANGAGKTTLMRSVSGLLRNRAEQILYRGAPIGGLGADRVAGLGIALVPEGRQLFPSLSVEENLIIGGRASRPGPWSLDAVYGLFPILRERRNAGPASLSGGQQQMAAIGRALMSNPDLLMFDEISLGLAPVIIRQIYEALPGIVSDGMTAVIVEQDITKALSVSGRVYCLREGRVSLEGSSDAVNRGEIAHAYFGT